jgi:hypothetical protein
MLMLIPISSYKPFTGKDAIPKPGCIPFETEFFEEMKRIKSGYYKDVIYQCRAIEDHKERQIFKAQSLPSITISCICKKWRKMENVVSHSALMVIDIDADNNPGVTNWKDYRDKLFSNTYVLCAFLSASEKGVAFIVKVIPGLHLDTFKYIEWDLKINNNVVVDPSGKDVVRLRFVSYDPELKLKPSFDDVPVIMPSEEFAKAKKENFKPVQIKFSSKADSYTTFSHAVEQASKHSLFEDGSKHHHIIRIASYCNHVGMSYDFCIDLFKNKYAETDTPWHHIQERVKNIYTTYKQQHRSKKLPKPPYTMKELRWLLKYVSKSLLKKYIYEYGQESYIGEETYRIQVSSRLLCFLMHLISPQYTWTVIEAEEAFTNEECKRAIPENCYLDSCNGSRVWCSNENKYPLNWN